MCKRRLNLSVACVIVIVISYNNYGCGSGKNMHMVATCTTKSNKMRVNAKPTIIELETHFGVCVCVDVCTMHPFESCEFYRLVWISRFFFALVSFNFTIVLMTLWFDAWQVLTVNGIQFDANHICASVLYTAVTRIPVRRIDHFYCREQLLGMRSNTLSSWTFFFLCTCQLTD